MNIQTVQIISKNICYGPEPKATDEVEQHLTISASGRVWFSARNYEQYLAGKGFCRRKQVNIGPWKAGFLLQLVGAMGEKPRVTDCGTYDVTLYDQSGGKKKTISGSLIDEAEVPLYGSKTSLTRLIRRYVPVYGLWVFNGSLSPDYEGKKAIHLFCKRWEELLPSGEQAEHEFADSFGEECEELGFQMDTANEFSKRYPGCFSTGNSVIDKVINTIDDVDLLGSAVFSQWRYLTHWAYMFTLNEKTVHWFLLVLDRMKELTRSE